MRTESLTRSVMPANKVKTYRFTLMIVLSMLAGLMLAGCSQIGVKPWQRGNLAKTEMQLNDDAMESAFADHIYFSREASSGGKGFGGGGCGCN